MRPKKATDTTFLLIRRGKALMQHRENKLGIRHPGKWNFPGGGIEEGETPIQCVVREVREETGLAIAESDCQLICLYRHDVGYYKADGDLDYVVLANLPDDAEITTWNGKPLEGDKMEFMSLSEIKKLDLAWEQERIVALLEE